MDFGQVVSAILRADEPVRRACFDRIAEMLTGETVERRRGALLASHLALPAAHTARLAATLGDPDEHVRFGAAWALARQGPDAVAALDQLLRRFEDDHHPTRDRAAWAVSNIGAPAIVPLLARLCGPSVAGRAIAAHCLGNVVSIRPDRPNAVADTVARSLAPPLLEALGDPEPWVRLCAAEAISRVLQRFVQPAMVELLDSSEARVREQAALRLCWASPDITDEAAGALNGLVADENSLVRHLAVEAMRRMGR